MSQTLTQTTAKRLLGLPAVARLMMFARFEGPAVLLSTTERLALFRQSGVFAEPASVNPSLSDWPDKREKVVLDLNSALRPFPVSPERYALTLTLGQDYPREAILEQLVGFGFARDELPGFVVRGDTVTVYLDADDEEKALRLEFFGDELDTLTLSGEAVESYVLAPREDAELGRRRRRLDEPVVGAPPRPGLFGLVRAVRRGDRPGTVGVVVGVSAYA